jgi:hypothetical protein
VSVVRGERRLPERIPRRNGRAKTTAGPTENALCPSTEGSLEPKRSEHGFAVACGAGAGGQTTPTTDGGNLIAKTKAYVTSGGQKPCP